MIRQWRMFLLAASLVLVPAVAAGDGETAVMKFTAETLSNNIISLQFLPGAEGRIVSLKYGDVEMFSPYRAEQISGNPLFAPVSANARGYCERFWKRQLSAAPLAVSSYILPNRMSAEVTMKFYGNSTLNLFRRMSLHPEGAIVDVTSCVESVEKADSAAYSFTVFPDYRAEIFFPAKLGDREFTAAAAAAEGTQRYQPAQPFAWCRYRGIIMAIVADDADFLMSWRARDSGARSERTMEIIGKMQPLPHTWHSRFIFFRRLSSLRGIFGGRGMDIQYQNGKAVLLVEAAIPVQAERVSVGGVLVQLPAQQPGELNTVELPALPAGYFPVIEILK